jgi:hypothetical protein
MPPDYRLTDFTLGDLPDAGRLISEYRFKPYYFVHSVKNDKLNELATKRLTHFLKKNESGGIGLRDDDGNFKAFAGYEELTWDTKLLDINCARIPFIFLSGDIGEQSKQARMLLAEIIAKAKSKGVQLINARTSAFDFGLIHPLEDAGFRVMDNGMTALYHKSVEYHYLKKGLILRDYQDGDLPTVLEILAGAYTEDRFHNDPRIPGGKAEELYAAWVTNSCTNPGKDEKVMVAEFEGKPAGFFQYQFVRDFSETTGIHVHSCGMAAVVQDRHGLGIYHSMLSEAIKIFIEAGTIYGMTRIPFSIQPILKLTLRLGPSFIANDLTFHLWLD